MRIEIPTSGSPIVIGDAGTDDVLLQGGVTTGLGMPSFDTPTLPTYMTGGVTGGRQSVQARVVEIDAAVVDDAVLPALSSAMAPRPDPTDVLALSIVDAPPFVTGTCTLYARPDGYDLSYDKLAWLGGVRVRLMFLAEDPVIYGAAVTESRTAAGSHSFTATNAGTHATRSGRAWTLELTASGTVVNPWIEIDDGDTARRVDFPVTLTTGQVLTVDHERQTWIGTQRISALPTTPSEDAPDWGVLGVGPNDVDLGADSGSFAVEFVYRSSWL